ncbi:MAG: hypothetical protein Q9164_004934 [Protoblastenia rupestris]
MERKPVYTIFPSASPTTSTTRSRCSSDKARPSYDQSPHPPPSSPLPPVPKSASAAHQFPSPPQQPLPPTPDSLRPARHTSRRKRGSSSPSRELAQFHKDLARSQRSTSPGRLPSTSASSQAPTQSDHILPRSSKASAQSDRLTSASSQAPTKSDRPASKTSQVLKRSSKQSDKSPDHDMLTSRLSTSSTSSLALSKPPIPSSGTTAVGSPTPTPQRHHRPNTVYFHGGIGGAGNYRKVIRENNRAPRAYAENAEPVNRRPSPTRFLSNLFGGQKGNGRGNGALEDRASGSEDSYREEVSLGAAEVMRRKLVGGAWRKRGP